MRLELCDLQSAGWPTASVESVCARITSGGTPSRRRPEYYTDGDGIPWVKTQELRDSAIDDTEEHITSEAVFESSAQLLPAGTLLVAMYAAPTAGRMAILDRPMACNQAACALVVDPVLAHTRYLYYQLLHARPQLHRLANGAAQQNLSARVIRTLEVVLPPLPEQRAISEVLGALDDKIALNTRLTSTCDEMLRSELHRALDPMSFRDGELPHGWVERPLSDLARFVNGRAFTKGASGTGRMVVRIAELHSGPGGSTVYNDIDVSDQHLARPGDLLFAWSGSLTVARWYRPEAIVNQHIFKVIPNDGIPLWFIHGQLLRLLTWFRGIAADKATTMGHIQRHHLDAPVVVPGKDMLDPLDSVCQPLWSRALAAEQESLTLAALRDVLLPKLLSGELRVREAEAAVSAAT